MHFRGVIPAGEWVSRVWVADRRILRLIRNGSRRVLRLATCFGPLRRFNLAHPWNVEVERVVFGDSSENQRYRVRERILLLIGRKARKRFEGNRQMDDGDLLIALENVRQVEPLDRG